ncbi:HAD family hydrolase, partial [Saccharopolyspora sp. HNM0983]|nr:HAD family hydrolase [Saccharopolyspora sp. HNM0983]
MTSAPDGSATRDTGQIKAVCLDIDDTLLDSERASRCGLRALVGSDRAWPVWQRTTDQFYSRFSSAEIDFDVLCVERTQAFFAAFGERIDAVEAARRESHR